MVTCDEAVATLNDEESGARQRMCARWRRFAGWRCRRAGTVFSSIQQLDRAFEAVLIDREEGKKKYGTSLGRMHEMMLIVLIRATNYGLSTSQLFEFVGGDVALALAIVQSILKVPAYEDELFAAVVQLLHGFLLAQTYAPAGGSALELEIEDFARRRLLTRAAQGEDAAAAAGPARPAALPGARGRGEDVGVARRAGGRRRGAPQAAHQRLRTRARRL